MGEVISRKAAADAIYADVATTLTRASARDDRWKLPAEARLSTILATQATLKARRAAAAEAVPPVVAQRDSADRTADDLVGGEYDALWNAAGRPGTDPVLDVIFPGGSGYYVDDDVNGQPLRMELLAELLETVPHPTVSSDAMKAAAARIRAAAQVLKAAVDATIEPIARLTLVERSYTAFAKVAQSELSRLKRTWRADGFSEADIHTVIPDRPSSKGKPAAPAEPAPPPPVTPS